MPLGAVLCKDGVWTPSFFVFLFRGEVSPLAAMGSFYHIFSSGVLRRACTTKSPNAAAYRPLADSSGNYKINDPIRRAPLCGGTPPQLPHALI